MSGWHQESRELSLQLSQYIGSKVDILLPKNHAIDPNSRIKNDAILICEDGVLKAKFSIPGTASNFLVVADLKSKAIRASMIVDAPRDRKTTKARIRWLLRQLKKADPTGIVVRIIWASRAPSTDVPLALLREELKRPEIEGSNAPPRAFEVILNKVPGARFVGRRTFIDEIERLCPLFYENIGFYLRSWHPTPAKPKASKKDTKSTSKTASNAKPSIGNQHMALLEIPDFLRRMERSREFQTLQSIPNGTPTKTSHPSRFRAFLISSNSHGQARWRKL